MLQEERTAVPGPTDARERVQDPTRGHEGREPHPSGRVVVGVDGGWASRRALRQAAFEASRRHTGVVVVTLVTPSWSDHDIAGGWRDADRDAIESARAVMEAARQDLRGLGAELALDHIDGIVAGSVDELAGLDPGLLVLGRSGAGGQGVFRMGSTSGALGAVFACPVLVCRDERQGEPASAGPALRQPEIVAAVHLEAEVPTVLRRAVEEATLRRMPLCVFTQDGEPGVQVHRALEHDGTVPWRIVHTSGSDAAEAILRYADAHDLLVLGNRGHGRLAGHVRGSVTRAVLDAMRCDVLLVPIDGHTERKDHA